MYSAIDIASGQHVIAPLAQRYRRYKCPACGARVSPRQGSLRDAHFAHVSGAARPECYLYYGSYGLLGPTAEPTSARPEPAPPPALLALTLNVQPPVGRGPARWALEVQVPRAPSPRGTLTFDGGGDGFRVDIACARLHAGAQSYVVNPDAATFRVSWVSRDVDGEYRIAVQERISGLDPTQSGVFVAGRGSRQALATGLSWGATYYFVQKAERAASVPRQLVVTHLADAKQWSCLLVTLPQLADDELANWLQEATGLAVHSAKRRWGVVSPARHFIDTSARLVIESGSDLTLVVHPGDGEESTTFRVRAADEAASVVLARGHWQFLRVGGITTSNPPVLEVDGRFLPELLVRPIVRAARSAMLSTAEATVAANSAEARTLLEHVRAGVRALTGVVVPKGLVPQVRSRPVGALDWEPLTLATAVSELHPSFDSLTMDALTQLQAVLSDTFRDVVVDLGPFGGWRLDGAVAADSTLRQLTSATRTHARWVLAVAGQPAIAARSKTDGALTAAVHALNPPPWLTAHHRLAMSRVAREGTAP